MSSMLSEKIAAVVDRLFDTGDRDVVRQILMEDCSDRLPLAGSGPHERVHLAILKISTGNIDKFLEAARLAQQDWRDVLVWADFGNDLEAHTKWADELLSSGKST